MKIVLVTGGFDPLHSGHLNYFKEAKKLGDKLIVGVNSDAWLIRKKGRYFMPYSERAEIIRNIKDVYYVVEYNDDDNSSCDAITQVRQMWPGYKLIFANGGDRTKENIPEMRLNYPDLSFVFEVGGRDKKNSSSWILDNWTINRTNRSWGWYGVIRSEQGYKVKELVINSHSNLSFQRHFHRNEHWFILKGQCAILTEFNGIRNTIYKKANETYIIGREVWHQCRNDYDEPCHILEIQYGDKCEEEDIERQ